jgi:hypothetical protein
MRGARADFHVIRLQQRATLGIPIRLQFQDDLLEGQHRWWSRQQAPMWGHLAHAGQCMKAGDFTGWPANAIRALKSQRKPTSFPPLYSPALSRPPGRERELTAVCGQRFEGRTYNATANEALAVEGSIKNLQRQPKLNCSEYQLKPSRHLRPHVKTACTDPRKTPGQIWLSAPSFARRGERRRG